MFGPLDNKAFFTEKVLKSKNPQDYDAIETLLRRVGKIDFFDTTQEQKGNPDNE